MTLIDTSVWIDHFRSKDETIMRMLLNDEIATHPMVVLELSLGSLGDRDAVLDALRSLPFVIAADDRDVARLIDAERLWGTGIGYVDAHLLAAARLTQNARLWTRDRRLRAVADRLGVGVHVEH